MNRLEVTNVFTEGMVMDFNPLVTPNNVVTNCLNGTLLTFNGNEYVLQNDMGNGRVESAYLPEGYVPLGTAELGGIIYIVSYNPLNNRCQVGSFPSPERNITSDELDNNPLCLLTNDDFRIDNNRGAMVYYLKKELNEDLTFSPGDKFIVYGDTISGNYSKLYNESDYNEKDIDEAIQHTIKLNIGAMTNSGLLVIFDNLKQFKVGENDTYHIMEYKVGEENLEPDLDSYRNLITQPYNVYSSKISGKLVIVAELVLFNDFDVELLHNFTSTEGEKTYKTYNPNIIFNFSGSYKFIPKGVLCKLTLRKPDEEPIEGDFFYEFWDESSVNDFIGKTVDFESYDSIPLMNILDMNKFGDIKEKINNIAKEGYFDKLQRNEGWILEYEFIPCMIWGLVSYLAVKGLIELDKLGTGYIGLNSWKYYKEKDKMSLTWGLDIYEEEGYRVDDVRMHFHRLKSAKECETFTYEINKKSSYHGVFYESLPFTDYYRYIGGPGKLYDNQLYLVKIEVAYNPIELNSRITEDIQPRTFYRWMYTSKVFNNYYVSESDFDSLTLKFEPSIASDYTVLNIVSDTVNIYGKIFENIDDVDDIDYLNKLKDPKTSLSGIQTEKEVAVNCNLTIGLKDTYNMFSIESHEDAFSIKFDSDNTQYSTSSTIKYTNREDANLKEYLNSGSLLLDELDKYKLESSIEEDKSDELLRTPTNIISAPAMSVPSFDNNIYSFDINYKTLQLVKAYCTKVETTSYYEGSIIPLAFDTDTYNKYNLEFDGANWKPSIIGTFDCWERGGVKGHVGLGYYSGGAHHDGDSIKSKDNINLKWTSDPDLENIEVLYWKGSTIFVVYYKGRNGACLSGATTAQCIDPIVLLDGSGPTERNAVILFLKSNSGKQCYYPIKFGKKLNLNGRIGGLLSNTVLLNLYNDFASVLNNLYRYSPETVTINVCRPNFLYYMDDCKYLISLPVTISSTESGLEKCNIYLKLDEGSILLKNTVNKFLKLLKSETISVSTDNITYLIQKVSNNFIFVVEDTDKFSGHTLREYMEDKQIDNLGIAITDYDGRTILKSHNGALNKSTLYMRLNDNIVPASKFNPYKVTFENGQNGNLKMTHTTNPISHTLSFNINNKFTLNEAGLLILRDPSPSDVELERFGHDDTGTSTGYLNTELVYGYSNNLY